MPDYFNILDRGQVEFDPAGGSLWLGDCLIQWGTATSTNDAAQAFSFNENFPTACFMVATQRTEDNNQFVLPVTAKSTTQFTINRNDALQGSLPFYWFAIGH